MTSNNSTNVVVNVGAHGKINLGEKKTKNNSKASLHKSLLVSVFDTFVISLNLESVLSESRVVMRGTNSLVSRLFAEFQLTTSVLNLRTNKQSKRDNLKPGLRSSGAFQSCTSI